MVKVHPGDSSMLDVTATNISGKPLAMPGMFDWVTVEVKINTTKNGQLDGGVKFAPDAPWDFEVKMIPPGGVVKETLDIKLYLWPHDANLMSTYVCRVIYRDPPADWVKNVEVPAGSRNLKRIPSVVGSVSSNAFVVNAETETPSIIEVR